MATESDLAKQCIAISELKMSQTEWVIKVLLLRQSVKYPYKNANGEGFRQLLIFLDEEGTKIQTTLFNNDVTKWENVFKPNHTYYIINGKIISPKPRFLSVHKDMEIMFKQSTVVKECNSEFISENFSNGFVPLDEAKYLSYGTLFDVVGILLQVKRLIGEGHSIRREVIITNEWHDRKTLTLWGDLAQNEGAVLESMQKDRPVIAFCDVKCSTYQGDTVLSTTYVTSMLFEPKFQKAVELLIWHKKMIDDDIDIGLTPSRQMQQAREVTLANIMDDSFDNTQDVYCKFNAKISEIKNTSDPIWYAACKKCFKKVNVIKSTANCEYYSKEDIDYEERYRLKIVVCADNHNIIITLFDGARYFLGCDVKKYISSTSDKKETSKYYRRMILSKGKEFTFLVKNYQKVAKEDRSKELIVEEMHEIGKAVLSEGDGEHTSTKKQLKRPNNDADNNNEDPIDNDKKIKIENK